MAILTDAQLLERVETFLAKHGLSEASFGLQALRDGGLVKGMREGRSLSLRNANKLISFMRDYRAPKVAKSPAEQASAA